MRWTTGRLVLGVITVAVLVVSACSDDGDEAEPLPEPTPEVEPDEPVATEKPVEVDVEAAIAEPEPAEPEPEPVDPPTYDFSAVTPIVADFVDAEELNGAGLIVVHRDHGVIHHEHWGEFDEDRISLIASSSKMITAGVLMRLDDEGLLDIDAPVADIVDWGVANPDITPAQLVSNSSGLVGLLPNPIYAPYLCQYAAIGTLQDCAETIFTTPDDDADIIEPDTEFRYGGAQWQVAGAVAEAASGKTWAELIEEIYVEPCELEALTFNNHFGQVGPVGFTYPTEFNADPATLTQTDNPNMEGGAYITTGDYGELLLMHLRGGVCGDAQVLSQGALDRLHGDRISDAYAGSAGSETGYGMGWWIDRASGRISDGGAYGTVPWIDLEDGYGAYLVIEADSLTGQALAAQLFDVIEGAVTEP